MKAKTLHKPRAHAHPRHRHNGNGLDTMINSAKQAGREARDAAMSQWVQPAMDAMRHTGERIEQGFHDTMESMDAKMKKMESNAMRHPVRTLACAVGAGVVIGLWLGRK